MADRIGVVLLTHGEMGKAMLDTCSLITGEQLSATSVSVKGEDDVDALRRKIARAIKSVDSGRGVLLLVDMFGGTPSNVGISFLEEGRVEVLTGVNLPMLTKMSSITPSHSLREAAELLRRYGCEHIKVAADYLKP